MARVRISLNAAWISRTREIANQTTRVCEAPINEFNEERRKRNAFAKFFSRQLSDTHGINTMSITYNDITN